MEKDQVNENPTPQGVTRREALKLSGMALGGVVLGSGMIGQTTVKALAADSNCQEQCPPAPACTWGDAVQAQQYSYFDGLDEFYPIDQSTSTTIPRLGRNEMRITFMGSCIPLNLRRVQQMMSIFVEVGWDDDKQMPADQFVFDCGSGVCTNYTAMNVNYGRMDKIFLTHLHGDHMSDLVHIYCFGPSSDRKSPLYVWSHGNSGVTAPGGKRYDDGVKSFCSHLRKACRWHSESFSFQTTRYYGYPKPGEVKKKWGLPCDPQPVSDDRYDDAYAMIPIELDWTKYGKKAGDNIAYHNRDTGVKITHFPVIHARQGSIGYKLEWLTPDGDILSMIFTGDTKPEYHSIEQARNGGKGVDVFIHEMGLPAEVWAFMNLGLDAPPPDGTPGWDAAVNEIKMVQNSSHSPQGAFGYVLSQITPRPRLTVATHMPVSDATVACAKKSVQEHFPNEVVYQGNNPGNGDVRMTWSFDRMVITVSRDAIIEQKANVSDFCNPAATNLPSGDAYPAKYHNPDGSGDPFAQIERKTEIPSCNRETDACNFREDGY
ncbi:MAG: MBL fold metallo-hydrolase [Thermodesulfobacteriota bacterium]